MTKCGACGLRLAPPTREPEACWWCNGDLCYACWDDVGHCGHPEAEAVNDAMRTRSHGDRVAMARALFGDDDARKESAS